MIFILKICVLSVKTKLTLPSCGLSVSTAYYGIPAVLVYKSLGNASSHGVPPPPRSLDRD